ncbi:seven transmembrane MLO family protein [Actinidia rufa]|uniref:MLO-like protein n=2 Tax=Actinidia rufa TaxID=165716 RepID=A0A7J0GTW5_9ERIC|nr:seven transmembrane MLO family protein [Actinidia rufa]
MLLGFISLLLTVGQGSISQICVSEAVGATWHPCSKKQEKIKYKDDREYSDDSGRRKLLTFVFSGEEIHPRVLTSVKYDSCPKGQVPFVSTYGIHQLHIFIFVLAVFHVLYCIITLALGRLKMRKWKRWEMETRTTEYEFTHDPERFRFTRETSFGRRHLNFWSHSPILLWIACFFRQFVTSVPKVDYLTLRHGFITAHLAPRSQNNFDFQKYIQRSLEEDFKVVVGISPIIWFIAVLFLLFNTHGWYSYLWLPFLPLIIILLVGAKLQFIITKMGLRIQARGEVVKGTPLVQPGDELFWLNRPRLLLYLIQFILFQNAFQLAFFAWAWMGTTMKPTIFNEQIARALRNWHQTAKKHIKQNRHSQSVTPFPTGTPVHSMSPVHLLRHYRSDIDSIQNSPRHSNFDNDFWKAEDSPSRYHDNEGQELSSVSTAQRDLRAQHEIDIHSGDFSFGTDNREQVQHHLDDERLQE